MSVQKKTNIPLVICIAAFIIGMGVGAWGLIKDECNGSPDCYVGSGFLMWTGGIMIVSGLLGMLLIGGKTNR
jgi:TRAP-type C4-dicarboxylate transport system permease small subunit